MLNELKGFKTIVCLSKLLEQILSAETKQGCLIQSNLSMKNAIVMNY